MILYRLKKKTANLLGLTTPDFDAYMKYFLPPKNKKGKRVVIFGQGRSGSTLLETLLASTGYFEETNEPLNVENKGEKKWPFQYIIGKAKSSTNYLFHVKIYQLTRDREKKVDPKKFLERLYKNGWFIIYLYRRDKVRHVLSNKIVEHRNAYHKTVDEIEMPRLHIDCENFVKGVEERHKFREMELRALNNVKFLPIIYEDDLLDGNYHQSTIDSVMDYVGLDHKPVSSRLKRINIYKPEDIIINYNEFHETLAKYNL